MKAVIILFVIVLLAVGFVWKRRPVPQAVVPLESEAPQVEAEKPLAITSPAFENGAPIPSKFTCEGANVNPPLLFSHIPHGTQSLSLIFDDPDVKPNPWVHWILWNIPGTTSEIAENSVPSGAVEGKTSFRAPGYGGSCPPTGTHHYSFRVYALDSMLTLPSSAGKSELMAAMEGHVLAEADLVGTYKKSTSK